MFEPPLLIILPVVLSVGGRGNSNADVKFKIRALRFKALIYHHKVHSMYITSSEGNSTLSSL